MYLVIFKSLNRLQPFNLMQITYNPPYVTLNSESKMLTWTTAESASD